MATNEALDPSIGNLASWVASGTGGSRSRITDDGTSDTDCIEVSGSTENGGARIVEAYVTRPMPNPTAERSFLFDARITSGDPTWRVCAFEYNASNSFLASTANVAEFTADSEWDRYSVTYTPVNANVSYVVFGVRRASSTASTIRVDSLFIAQTALLASAPRPSRVFVLGSKYNIGPMKVGRR